MLHVKSHVSNPRIFRIFLENSHEFKVCGKYHSGIARRVAVVYEVIPRDLQDPLRLNKQISFQFNVSDCFSRYNSCAGCTCVVIRQHPH